MDLYPVTLAVAFNRLGKSPLFFSGASCAITAHEAISGAVSELETVVWHQLNHASIPFGDKAESVEEPKDHGDYYLASNRLDDLSFLTKGEVSDRIGREKTVGRKTIFEMIEQSGLKLYYKEVTCKEITESSNLRVVRVIADLFPMTFGYGYEPFANARLSDVPLKLGLMARQRTPSEHLKNYKIHFFA